MAFKKSIGHRAGFAIPSPGADSQESFTILINHDRKGAVTYRDYWLLLARVGMSSLFLFSGFEKIVKYHDFVGFATSGGLPFAATVAPFVIFAEITGSCMLILGWNARAAAIFFAGFCAILGPWFHQFWNASPERWQESVDGFFHHFVMAGGFVLLAIHGPGALSLQRRRAGDRCKAASAAKSR